MKREKKFQAIREIKSKKGGRLLIFWAVIALVIFCLAAMLYVGVGDAEWAGMTVSNITANQAVEYGLPQNVQGVVIKFVEDQAYYSGVKEGDLLKAINGSPVRSVSEFLKVARGVDMNTGVLLDILRRDKPLYITLSNKVGLHTTIKEWMDPSAAEWRKKAMAGESGPKVGMTPVALTAPVPSVPGRLPTPKEQGAAKKILVEGHWLGMELIPLTPELATEYLVPENTEGLLVDEVSLESAECGFLAGDMVEAVDGVKTPDLLAFTEATRLVQTRESAEVLIYRRGRLMKIFMKSERSLGFSQNEAAQPIQPGAISPHRVRSQPCTACHIIMRNGGQLPTDAGDILPNPPPIVKGAVAPHSFRGQCKNCHVVLKK